jgi:hypothetical protein
MFQQLKLIIYMQVSTFAIKEISLQISQQMHSKHLL